MSPNHPLRGFLRQARQALSECRRRASPSQDCSASTLNSVCVCSECARAHPTNSMSSELHVTRLQNPWLYLVVSPACSSAAQNMAVCRDFLVKWTFIP